MSTGQEVALGTTTWVIQGISSGPLATGSARPSQLPGPIVPSRRSCSVVPCHVCPSGGIRYPSPPALSSLIAKEPFPSSSTTEAQLSRECQVCRVSCEQGLRRRSTHCRYRNADPDTLVRQLLTSCRLLIDAPPMDARIVKGPSTSTWSVQPGRQAMTTIAESVIVLGPPPSIACL